MPHQHASANAALRAAVAFPARSRRDRVLPRPEGAAEGRCFLSRVLGGADTAERAERGGALGGVTGHHGVDLLMLGPGAERIFAVEVKGTLRPRRWPRLRRAEIAQIDVAWLEKVDNPAMQEWGVRGDDVYRAVVGVNLHELAYKVVLTRECERWHPVVDVAAR